MRPIRVLYVIGSLDVGGSERQLVELLRRIDRSLIAPAVLCLTSEGPLAADVRELGITVDAIGYEGFRIKRHPVRTLAALWRLRARIVAFAPDVVHTVLFWACVLGTLAARSAGVPVVIGSRRGLGHFRRELSRGVLAVEAAANRRTDVFVANAEAVRLDAIAGENLPGDRVRVIYNGVDAERLDPRSRAEARARLGVAADARLLVVVANLIAYKGHRVLLDAFSDVKARLPKAEIALLGDGVEREALEAQALRAGLASAVRFVGSTPEVRTWLAAADLVVHPSFEEGFCNAILEAMAAGRAVVATNVGGIPEAVVDGDTGWLVPPRDADALASAICDVVPAPDRLARAGEAGRERVRQHFLLDRTVHAHEMLYKEWVFSRSPVAVRPRI